MIRPIDLINKLYPLEDELKNILLVHSRSVTRKALDIAEKHPELQLNTQFIAEAAMLHDIGIGLTNAPGIHCHGDYPYICHGYLGADFLREAGYPEHALVCERHTGAGLSLQDIIKQNLPLPHRDMLPVSMEEQVICFADKFFRASIHTDADTMTCDIERKCGTERDIHFNLFGYRVHLYLIGK